MMDTRNPYEKPNVWEKRLYEWKVKASEQQHFHENISTHLKTVYKKQERTPKPQHLLK